MNYDCEALRITVDYNNMMQETLGARGLTQDELLALPLADAVKSMKDKRGQMKWRELPHNRTQSLLRSKKPPHMCAQTSTISSCSASAEAHSVRSRCSRRFRICTITIFLRKSETVRVCSSKTTLTLSA